MAQIDPHLSTGMVGLDRVLTGLIPGDNLVFQVEDVEDYRPFAEAFWKDAVRRGFRCVYFRFTEHPTLVPDGTDGVEIVRLDPAAGVEVFLSRINSTVDRLGPGTCFVFDCLSDLAEAWYSDQMLANFFKLTCPHVLDVHSLAYFAILRNNHSQHATAAVSDTCQVWMDVYRHEGRLFLHPWKVQSRHSPTIHLLHAWNGEKFHPITASPVISPILTSRPWLRRDSSRFPRGIWERNFVEAEQMSQAIEAGKATPEEARPLRDRLLRMAVSRDPRVLALAEEYFTLEDLLRIGRRMIGTGLVGGKTVGMLLARAILRKNAPDLFKRLEPHDSFYIGSDVFYSFLVHNGLWWIREKQKDLKSFLEGAEQARQRILVGNFPRHIYDQIEDMLDYFGQSPIIARSSSLLEDNFGNAFAGKYESVFCVNQAPRNRRLEDLIGAIQTIYASSMSHQALTYRAQRDLLELDEQMAVLVQRVSGGKYSENFYFPHIAGVGFSFNPYVWNENIDPHAGVLRLVFGMGTRAVDRTDDDYTRLVALNAPDRRPESTMDEIRQYSQQRADVLDLDANQLVSRSIGQIFRDDKYLPSHLLVSEDEALRLRAEERGLTGVNTNVLTFQGLFDDTPFISDMRKMMETIQKAYNYPVDVEFTTNFLEGGDYGIDLLQCRPLQVKEGGKIVNPPSNLDSKQVLIDAHGPVLGCSRLTPIDRIIYVTPHIYGNLPIPDRYAIARLIGQVTRLREGGGPKNVLLMGPGRWGTTTPSLGIPVHFQDIHNVSVMCEIVTMRDDLIPDVSLGTHFFSELVELDMLYFAMFPHREDTHLDTARLESAPNRLPELLPDEARWSEALRIIDTPSLGQGRLLLNANVLTQRVLTYFEKK